MKKVGAFVGKFYPPHKGHVWAVEKALNDLDEVYVIVSANIIRNKDIKQEQDFENLDANLIRSWLAEHFKNNPRVKVKIFDESGLKPYPDDRDVWAEKFKKEFPEVNVKIADESYREYNEKYFPEYEFYPIDRDYINIHSTDIRKDMVKNFEFIIDEAKEYFRNFL